MYSLLTHKVVAFQEIQYINTDDCIDWAIEMIELGYDNTSLLMLASFSKPTNYFEIINYLTDAVEELGLTMKKGDSAILSYASFYIQKIAKKENVRENLTEVKKFCNQMNYEDLVYDFYSLFWAWDQLDYEDNGYNHYWNDVSRDNIQDVVIQEARKWMLKNKTHLTLS